MNRARRGQSTTEFALMIPLIFALLFAVIEYAYYFGALHYTNYATFSVARATQGGLRSTDALNVASMLLTGNMTSYRDGDVRMQVDNATGRVETTFLWQAQTPGFKQVMGVMDAQMSVTLGPQECEYESSAANARSGVTANAYRYADNKMECN